MTQYDLPRRLYSLRKNAGISQDELARRMEVDRSTISNFERGKRELTVDGLLKYRDIFGVSVSELIPDEPAEFTSDMLQLVDGYRKLDERDQQDILDSINIKLVRTTQKERTQAKNSGF